MSKEESYNILITGCNSGIGLYLVNKFAKQNKKNKVFCCSRKNNNISNTENLLREIGYNCKTINIYEDYQLDGINKYIRTNYKILIFEFEMIDNIENFLELIVSFRNVKIEYIYYENSALYVSKNI